MSDSDVHTNGRVYVFEIAVWSGSKDMLKGWVDVSVRVSFDFSASSFVDE